jgi:hypothetical protein
VAARTISGVRATGFSRRRAGEEPAARGAAAAHSDLHPSFIQSRGTAGNPEKKKPD